MDPTQVTTPESLPADSIMSLLQMLGQKSQPQQTNSNAQASNETYQAATAPAPDPSSIQAYAKQQSDSMFGQGHWDALHQLINNESGWNPNAQNPGSSAYGLGQFLDSTWQGVGMQKTSDPQSQVDATLKYIGNRYGNPTSALNFWQNIAPTQSAGGGSHWY